MLVMFLADFAALSSPMTTVPMPWMLLPADETAPYAAKIMASCMAADLCFFTDTLANAAQLDAPAF